MRKTMIRVAVAAVLAIACLALPARGADDGEKAAQLAADQWLALVDANNYAESWKQAATIFKKQLTAEQWESAVKSVHSKTGKLVSRKFRVSESANSLPGAPEGEYVILKYDTVFEQYTTATETVVPVKEKDGSWKVSGYFVK